MSIRTSPRNDIMMSELDSEAKIKNNLNTCCLMLPRLRALNRQPRTTMLTYSDGVINKSLISSIYSVLPELDAVTNDDII